jgi:predicted esterase
MADLIFPKVEGIFFQIELRMFLEIKKFFISSPSCSDNRLPPEQLCVRISAMEEGRMAHARRCYDLWKNQPEDISYPFPHSHSSSRSDCDPSSTVEHHLPHIRRVNLDSLPHRFFIFTLPESHHNSSLPQESRSSYDLLIFFHGSRGNVYNQLALTNLSSYLSQGIITAYGQCSGEMVEPYVHPSYRAINYGEIYWEIRDRDPQFHEDVSYTREIIRYMRDHYPIHRIFTIGHSNGGVFNIQLALHMPNIFAGIVSHQGGIGYDPRYYLDFSVMNEEDHKTPILFYTGTDDIHKDPCIWAADIFRDAGFPVELYIEQDGKHRYESTSEPFMIRWLLNLSAP